jgi:MinD superfamily P-loop ATPase
MMKIAIASGKGGTGKTTVATNLALAAAAENLAVAYLDCDVEEPNGALFLKPEIERELDVEVSIPEVDLKKCAGCGICGKICQLNAIAAMGKNILIFPELCHGCGGCWLVCPVNAITESKRITGKLQIGQNADGVKFIQGLLNIGEAMSPPVINAVKRAAPEAELTIIDSPPGTSCPVIESIRNSDYVILVTEPTPFGLNDLKLAVDMVKALELPFGVVINRADSGDDKTRRFCRDIGVGIIEIPDSRKVAEAYSRGESAFNAVPEFRDVFTGLLDKILAIAKPVSRQLKRSVAR